MICRAVIGQVEDETASGIDWVDLEWPQTLRRALRLMSRAGRSIDVLLPPGGRLGHGDVLSQGPSIIAVWLAEIEVLAIATDDSARLTRLAFELGNRHIPAQISADVIYTPDDGPARAVVAAHGLPCGVGRVRFWPEPVTLDSPFFGGLRSNQGR